jgi:hypothetical protein
MTPAPGPALYIDDQPGAEPQACEIRDDGEQLVAVFPRTDADDGAEIPVDDMAGRFVPAP